MFRVYLNPAKVDDIYVLRAATDVDLKKSYKGLPLAYQLPEDETTQFDSLSTADLVALYNALLGPDKPPISKFENREKGARRTLAELNRVAVTVGVKVPKGPKAAPASKATPIRDGTSLAKLLRGGITGTHTVAQLAEQAGIREDQARHRIRHNLRTHGINSTITEDGVVLLTLPAGKDLDAMLRQPSA